MPKAKKYPPLTDAQRALVEHNTGLVSEVLDRCFAYVTGDGREEAYLEGLLALCKAARSFDPGRGWKFSTYGCVVVRNWLVHWVGKWQRRGFKGLGRVRLEYPLNIEAETWGAVADREREPTRADVFTLGALEPAVRRLPARHQLVIREVYQNRATFTEVGARLGVSKNRAQQMRDEALVAMRGASRAAA